MSTTEERIGRNALRMWLLNMLQVCAAGDEEWDGVSDGKGGPNTLTEFVTCLTDHELRHPDESLFEEEFCPFCSLKEYVKLCRTSPKELAPDAKISEGTIGSTIIDLLQYPPNARLYVSRTHEVAHGIDQKGDDSMPEIWTEYFKPYETWIYAYEETEGFSGHKDGTPCVLVRIEPGPFHREDECGEPI
jgi:hypothetical protein